MLPLPLVLLLLLVPATAVADAVYEVTTTGSSTVGSKNNDVYIGQAFNSGTNTLLTSAQVQVNSDGLGLGNFTLNLFLATGSTNAYFKTGNALHSLTLSNSVLSATPQSFYNFENLNWGVSPNTVYMLGFESESTPTVKWTLNQSVVRDSSTGFITGFVGYNAQRDNVVDDGLHGATIYGVPEPSTLALAAGGLAALVVSRRRRRRGSDEAVPEVLQPLLPS